MTMQPLNLNTMIKWIKDNAAWVHVVSATITTACVFVGALWLNANYVPRQEFALHVKGDTIEQAELQKTLNTIAMNIVLLQKDNDEHKAMSTAIKEIDARLRTVEIKQVEIGGRLKNTEDRK